VSGANTAAHLRSAFWPFSLCQRAHSALKSSLSSSHPDIEKHACGGGEARHLRRDPGAAPTASILRATLAAARLPQAMTGPSQRLTGLALGAQGLGRGPRP